MRLLVVAPYPPTSPLSGGRRRIFEELRALSRRNTIDLCCLTFDDDEEHRLTHLKLPNVRVHSVRQRWRDAEPRSALPLPAAKFWNDGLAGRVADLAAAHSYDWVLAEHCYAAPYIRDLPMRKMLTEHNIEYRLFEQIAAFDEDLGLALALCGSAGELFRDAAEQLPALREFEQSAWTQMDLCMSVSEVERRIIAEANPNLAVHVAPNCPDAGGSVALHGGPPTIAFIGALNYFPNVDAIVHLIRQVLPRIRRAVPDVKIVAAGRDPEPEMVEFCATNGVQAIANPDSIGALLTSRTVLACPLRFGAGTRIKVLDAMVRGIPVVGSSLAMEGLGGSGGCEFLVGDGAEEFSKQLMQGLMSDSLRSSISLAASRHLNRLDLSWGKVFADVERRLTRFDASTETA